VFDFRSYESSTHPGADDRWIGFKGYGTLDGRARAKHVLTVGSVSDALDHGVRGLGGCSIGCERSSVVVRGSLAPVG
jgi:hypothetical protein